MVEDMKKSQDLSDSELAEQFLESKQDNKSVDEKIALAEKEMKDWYDKEFVPYKKAKEQEKKEFETFRLIIKNHPQEVKHMLGSIFENDIEEAVKTWNYLKLVPTITDMKLEGENLIITDVDDDINEVHFESLLDKIDSVLGG